jgi:amino-acid N-acetyltransferase
VSIVAAVPSDRGELIALLAAAELPLDGLDDAFPHGFALARDGAQLVGAAGVELWGAHALLRSVVVAPTHRKHKLGEVLVADRVRWARGRGAAALWLFTLAAEAYFARLGFARVPRDELPSELGASTQLSLSACTSATAMTLRL